MHDSLGISSVQVSNRDFLFYEPEHNGSVTLAANVSIDPSAFWADQKQGINGMITVSDCQGTTLLVGAAMSGQLVAATLALHGSHSGMPRAFGFRSIQGEWEMGGAYDIDAYSPTSDAPHPVQPLPPLAVVVSPARGESKNVLGIVQMHDSTTNTFLPPERWQQLGAVPFHTVVASSGASNTTGCNRVRVHARTHLAAFSCAQLRHVLLCLSEHLLLTVFNAMNFALL